MAIGKKGGKSSFNVGMPKQQPATFGQKKVGVPLKKGGSVCMKKGGAVKHDDAAQDKKLIAKMITSADKKEAGMKKGGSAKVRYSVSDSGNPVKPVKMAAGGAAKDRRGGFKDIKHQPKPKKS